MPNGNKGAGKLTTCINKAAGDLVKVAACEAAFLSEPGTIVLATADGGKVFTDPDGGKVFVTKDGRIA
jgi:hypothetical protein